MATSTAQLAVAGNSARRASPWIVAPATDLSLIVAAPALVWCGLMLGQFVWTPAQITSFALIWAIGHHLPGLMRAYGDRGLFQRFRLRFIIAPIVVLCVGLYSTWTQSSAIPLAVGFWGLWHYLMQTYGFLRIYDSKARSVSRMTCALDQAMCLTWFAGAAILTNNGLFSDLNLFYKAGGPLISPSVITASQTATMILLVVVTALFLGHTLWQTWRGDPPSPLKLALMATTFGYYWYCLASVSNLLVAYALFELFHDAQYLTIVWAFNVKRGEKDAGAGGFTRFLFRRRGALVACYLALILGYGLLNYGTRELLAGPLQRILLGVFLASTILHYYYDGFIWKLRETDTRRTLGLADGAGGNQTTGRHWLTWSLATVPICGLIWLAVRETQHPNFGLDKHDALVASLPNSVFAHHNRGIALAAAGQLDAAEAAQRRALQLNPYYADIHYDLGTVHVRRGETDAARLEFQRTLKLDPLHVEANYNLGVLLLGQGRHREALPFLETAARLRPRKPEMHNNLGSALVMSGRNKEATVAFRRALELNAGSAETHNNLAQALAAVNDPNGALFHYRQAAALQPDSAITRFNLGIFLELQNRPDEAIATYRESLRIDPKSGDVWNNLGVALAKQRQLEQAIDAFRKSVELSPQHASARQNLERATSMLNQTPH